MHDIESANTFASVYKTSDREPADFKSFINKATTL